MSSPRHVSAEFANLPFPKDTLLVSLCILGTLVKNCWLYMRVFISGLSLPFHQDTSVFMSQKCCFFNYWSLVIQTEIRKCKASRSDTRVGITLNLELTLDSMGILSVLIIPINGHWCLFVTSLISSIKPPNLGYRSFTGSLCQIYFEYFTFQYCCSLDCFPFLNRLLLVYRNRRNFVQQ